MYMGAILYCYVDYCSAKVGPAPPTKGRILTIFKLDVSSNLFFVITEEAAQVFCAARVAKFA